MDEGSIRREVERRLGRPFDRVQRQLEELFGREWDEVVVFVATSALKKQRSEADVIVDLVAKAEEKPPVATVVRRAVVRWIGKPWRERENPWDKYKDRIPKPPPSTTEAGEPWRPLKPSEED